MSGVTRSALWLGLSFLYAPIFVLVAYSFNASNLVTVWGGFSIRWYAALFSDGPLIAAAWVSLQVAVFASLTATVLGTLAALALERHGRFRGRSLFTGLVYGPMVMPEVMIGLSLLLLFIGIGLDRGLVTIVIAHATFCTGFVAVVVAARLRGLDRSLEEAAADLGAGPFRVLTTVTLPLSLPRSRRGHSSPSRCHWMTS
ncbi:ABC transporter permease [Deinococcus caeni]|uniref:ABC transporter permease n=1 Tax=Deinococcus caeni TaxID=569127 RepID=UPI00360AEACB